MGGESSYWRKEELDAAGTRHGRASGQHVCKSLCTIGKHTRELCHFTLSRGTSFHFRWVCRFGLSISGAGRQLRTRFPGARTDRLPSLSQLAWFAILLLHPISEHQESLVIGRAMICMPLGELILFTKSTNHLLCFFQSFGSYLEYCRYVQFTKLKILRDSFSFFRSDGLEKVWSLKYC